MLKLHNLNYESTATLVFQRLSVICSDVVYFYGIHRSVNSLTVTIVFFLSVWHPPTTLIFNNIISVCHTLYPADKGNNHKKRLIILALALFNPGLLMVDRILDLFIGLSLSIPFRLL
jgi:hypothetical protein